MNFAHTLRLSTLTVALIAGNAAWGKTFVMPHVLDSSGRIETCAPRDAATGQASGKRQHGWNLKENVKAREAAPAGCDAPPAAEAGLRESPTRASTGRGKELTGHVTLIK